MEDKRKRRLAILGSTGSIGTQTLDIVRRYRDSFEVELLAAGNNAELLIAQALEFDAGAVVIGNEDRYSEVAEALQPKGIKVFAGADSIAALAAGENIDIVVGAMVGFSGLRSTLAALEAGKIVALANKETLVAAGSIVTAAARAHKGLILPVDSEHSAIFQCLLAAQGNEVEMLHLTASGGPFRTWPKEKIAAATKDAALKHPNWSMGAKVTIDSATMMNKGFEMMEAHWLFDMEPERINVVVHPESVIHSMIEFSDGAVLAQMACPDMREPIGFALGFPQRLPFGGKRLDFSTLNSLTFEKADTERFPCLALAYEAAKRGGNIPCALNAANEVAVDAYLHDRIAFYDIARIAEGCITGADFVGNPSLEDIFATHEAVTAKAREML